MWTVTSALRLRQLPLMLAEEFIIETTSDTTGCRTTFKSVWASLDSQNFFERVCSSAPRLL